MRILFNRPFPAVLVLFAVMAVPVVGSATTADEISHLLLFIEQSQCEFFRNEKSYTPLEARQHIEQKYDHIRKRVRTAEDFIRYAASGSSMSGRPYRVICGGVETLSADWLQAELEKLRATN